MQTLKFKFHKRKGRFCHTKASPKGKRFSGFMLTRVILCNSPWFCADSFDNRFWLWLMSVESSGGTPARNFHVEGKHWTPSNMLPTQGGKSVWKKGGGLRKPEPACQTQQLRVLLRSGGTKKAKLSPCQRQRILPSLWDPLGSFGLPGAGRVLEVWRLKQASHAPTKPWAFGISRRFVSMASRFAAVWAKAFTHGTPERLMISS